MRTAERRDHVAAVMMVIAASVVLAAIFAGARSIAWFDVLRATPGSIDADIVWRIRVPRVCLGFVSGAVLAVGGLAFQAVFRNPLATPYTMGISAGASVG